MAMTFQPKIYEEDHHISEIEVRSDVIDMDEASGRVVED